MLDILLSTSRRYLYFKIATDNISITIEATIVPTYDVNLHIERNSLRNTCLSTIPNKTMIRKSY